MHIVVFSSILAATCGYALWRGGAPERLTALMMLAAFAATFWVPFRPGVSFHHLNTAILGIDLVLFALLVCIALCANRFWPLWVAAVQLMAIGIHLVKAHDPTLVSWLYNSASGKIAYPMVIMLAIGVVRHRERMAAHGSDPDWSIDRKGHLAT